jgi:hypothetical protein
MVLSVRSQQNCPNLPESLESATAAVDRGGSVDLAYLDFAKALVTELGVHRVRGRLLAWAKRWLSNRGGQSYLKRNANEV